MDLERFCKGKTAPLTFAVYGRVGLCVQRKIPKYKFYSSLHMDVTDVTNCAACQMIMLASLLIPILQVVPIHKSMAV